MSRHRTDRARRPATPALERLEARALLTKTPAAITFHEIPLGGVAGAFELAIIGTSKNDAITIVDNGTGAAGNISVTTGSGLSFKSQNAITVVGAVTGKGNDRVTYELTGDLKAGVSEEVFATSAGSVPGVSSSSGGGNLRLEVDIAGKVPKGATLLAFAGTDPKAKTAMTFSDSSEIDGDVGVGVITTSTSSSKKVGPVSLSFNSTSTIDTDGSLGFGNLPSASQSTVSANYVGTNNGQINFEANGAGAKDNLSVDIAMTAGSTGRIGSTSQASNVTTSGKQAHALLTIRRGNDSTSTTGINAVIKTSSSKSVSQHTANVTNQTSGKDTIIP